MVRLPNLSVFLRSVPRTCSQYALDLGYGVPSCSPDYLSHAVRPTCSNLSPFTDVYIYYKGGGVRKLFRKTKRESSRFHDNLIAVRSTGNYIYEQFYEPEQCADVKVYAVGDYFYAEARKAPHIDGIVDRDQRGRERRIHVILSESELAICRKATAAFDQFVLGFDLLRGPADHRFVIDVNGWSLVKNSEEYAMQCGKLLAKHIELALQKHAQGIDIVQQKKRASLLHAALAQTSQQTTAELFDASQGNTCVV